MSSLKKLNSRLIKSLLIFGVFILVIISIAPLLVNLELVRENIENTISKEIKGDLKYRHLNMSYFPLPHIVVQEVVIRIPDSFTIKTHRMKIYPKILHLLAGKLRANSVTLEHPNYEMKLPQIRREVSKHDQTGSFDEVLTDITKAIRRLPEFKLPELKMRIISGKINLADPFGREFILRDVQAAYRRQSDKLDISMQCKSNLWDQIDVGGTLNPLDFKGKGHIRLSRLRPQALMAYLLDDPTLQVTDIRANLAIDVELAGAGDLKAAVNGAVPLLALSRGQEQIWIRGGRIRGTVRIADKTVGISLTEMGWEYPKLEATGMFSYDENLPDIQLAIDGVRIDAASVRQVALGLAGESETIQNIFRIIRGGDVPWMTVRVRGHSIAELGMLENIVIKGRMTQGNIFIPGAELNLGGVIGDALISEGILYGDNLQAQMGGSSGRDGQMKLGLKKNLTSFYLNIGVDADLSQLPPVLGRVVKEKDFLEELALVDNVRGTATGILMLGDDLSSLNAKVDASNIHFTARYKRIPYPVEIDGGRFNYGGTRLEFHKFKANIGMSSFLDTSFIADWTATPDLDVKSQAAKIDLNELHTWLQSYDIFKNNIYNIRDVKGEAAINNLEIKGPFFSPLGWRFNAQGIVNNLILISDKLSKSLKINRGQFRLQGTKIQFSDVEAKMGRSSVRSLAGDVSWGDTPVFSARSGPALFHLEDIGPIIDSYKSIAAALDRFKPISGALAFKRTAVGGPLLQPSVGQVSFSADLDQFRLHSKHSPSALRIDRGNISWRKNRLALKKIDIALGNSGISNLSAVFKFDKSQTFELNSRSVKLVADELYPWILSFQKPKFLLKEISVTKGTIFLPSLNLNGPLYQPAQWRYSLTCNMENLVLTSVALGDPLTINSGSFEMKSDTRSKTAQNRIRLNSTELTWSGNHLKMIGAMILSKNEILLDMTLAADTIDWNQVKNIVEYAEKQSDDPHSGLGKRDLRGSLKVIADNFNYETYSVTPLKADLSFKPDTVVITFNEAVVCNLAFQGWLNVGRQTLEINLVPNAVNQALAPALSCITDQAHLATGTFNLNGQLQSNSKPDKFLRSLSGEVVFSAEKGRINRFGLLAKIFSILNVTEIYRGELPDLTGEGFAYHGLNISANFEGGKLILQECAIDGVSMGIACEGDIDLFGKNTNLIVLVAPFKTVDRIVKILPLLKHVLGGKLISIPFRAKGDIRDPEVIPLPPTAIGSGVLGILERTLKLPITIMQPVFSNEKNKRNVQNSGENSAPSGLP